MLVLILLFAGGDAEKQTARRVQVDQPGWVRIRSELHGTGKIISKCH